MCFANKEKALFTRMSRSKSRLPTDICGDCGSSGELLFFIFYTFLSLKLLFIKIRFQ